MNLLLQKRAAGVFLDIARRKRSISSIQFHPRRPSDRGRRGYLGTQLPRSTPEREGISSRRILSFLRDAQQHPTINPHTLLVLRHGKVISECSFAPFSGDTWHVTHSMCKGVTALAVGMLLDDGKLSLDDRISELFPGRLSLISNPVSYLRMKNITVRQLLTMSSGVTYSEAGALTSEDWVKGFLDSGVRFEPGTEFAYNSMNSYLLSVIVREKTGVSLAHFLKARLFAPLGIRRFYWEKCPKGIEKGGWGLYLYPEDMAKIGQLLLQDGVWNGRRLISHNYLREMTRKQIDTPPEMGEQGYGFHTWMGMRPGSYLFNGILGQNLIMLPDLEMVIVTTGGNDCLFKTSSIISLVEQYFEGKEFSPDPSRPADRKALTALRHFEKIAFNKDALYPEQDSRERFWRGRSLPMECRLLNGREYRIDAGGARLLPLFTQLLQNNYTTCIDTLSFSIEDGGFYLTVREGKESNKLPLSFDGTPLFCTVTANGEAYPAAASAKFALDEDGNTVLKVFLAFLEQSSGRKLKVFFYRNGKIELALSEIPDGESLLNDTGLFENRGAALWVNRLVAKKDTDVFAYTVRRAVEPRIRGVRVEQKPIP